MFKSGKKSVLAVLLVAVLALFIVAFGGCQGGGRDDRQQPQIPAHPPGLEVPELKLPDVDEAELVGNADKTTADAVIILKGNTAEISGRGASVSSGKEYAVYDANGLATGETTTYGTVVEISQSGTYVAEGTLSQGFIAVSKKELSVTLVLNGVNIYCKNYAAVTCLKKSDITVELADGSTNYLTDGGMGANGGKYAFAYDSEEQPNATLLVRKDLTICGKGMLTVNGGSNNGIGCRANLTISGGNIAVYAPNNAVKGNDSVTISGGNLTFVSKSDGIKTESVEGGLGRIDISGGDFVISAANDGVQAATALTVSSAVMKIITGGGSGIKAGTDSAKGLKASTDLTVRSGVFDIDANDDCIHSNGTVTISGGEFEMSSADDGIHADGSVTINDCTMNIATCYEGIEATNINLNGGSVRLKASDDGINISNGADNSAGTKPGGGRPGGVSGGIDGTLTITGGSYYVDSTGDGLDSNGNITMTGGLVVVAGPTADMDAPIDYDGTFKMTGGTIVALGSSGMAQQPGSTSTQYTFLAKFTTAVSAGSLINVSDSSGKEIMTIKATKSTKSMALCSPLLERATYKISSGGTHTGAPNNFGIYENGVYTAGTVLKTFTISSITTTC